MDAEFLVQCPYCGEKNMGSALSEGNHHGL